MHERPFKAIEEFWPYYVNEHKKALTRQLHFAGNTNLLLWLLLALLRRSFKLVLVAIVSSYLIAWVGHFFVERNLPATFKYPMKSAICDMIMYTKMWSGKMDAEVSRHVNDQVSNMT